MKSMKIIFLLVLFFTLAKAKAEDPFITIYLSFKVILNSDGTRPDFISNEQINNCIDSMNTLMDKTGRGYRFKRLEIIEIGGNGDPNGVSRWASISFLDLKDQEFWNFETLVRNTSPQIYRWSTQAINVYINQATRGGVCSRPTFGHDVVTIGSIAIINFPPVFLHEIGHYFNLCHTHGCDNNCKCNDDKSKCNSKNITDDEVADTPLDDPCWGLVQMIKNNPGLDFAGAVNLLNNLMSYHNLNGGTQEYISEGQLDRWADAMDERKSNVVPPTKTYNRTSVRNAYGWFIHPNAGAPQPITNQINYFPEYGNSYKEIRLSDALIFDKRKGGHGIIFMRSGTYHSGGIKINQPITFRATRAGSAVITK